MRVFPCVALLLAFVPQVAFAQVSVTRTSSDEFYIDLGGGGPELLGSYTSYRVENTGTTDLVDVWATVGNFTSPGTNVMSVATNAASEVRLGDLAAGETAMAYFYLMATTDTLDDQLHDVTVYEGQPSAGGAAVAGSTTSFTLVEVQDVIQAAASQVDTVVNGPTPPVLGGIVTLTVNGTTGNLGDDGRLAFTPAAEELWPADKFQLISSTITVSWASPVTTVQLQDTLVLPNAPVLNNADYSAVYRFRAIGTTVAPATVSPMSIFRIGASNLKHDDTTNFGSVAPIAPALNESRIAKIATPNVLGAGGGTVTYSISLINPSDHEIQLDSIHDALPTSPDTTTFVAGSTLLDGVAHADPVIVGADLTWLGPFVLPANGTRAFSYQVIVPATAGVYTNAAYALIGSEQVDATGPTTDDVPTTADVVVGATPAILVTPTSGFQTSEAGTTAQFSIVLSTAPSAQVDITVQSQAPAEGLVSTLAIPAAATSVVVSFDAGNFSVPQIVTITGQDELVVDGTVTYTVEIQAAVSGDGNYAGKNPADLSVENFDDDVATIEFVNASSTVLEGDAGSLLHPVSVRLTVPNGGTIGADVDAVVGDGGTGTATRNVDFTEIGVIPVNFPSGSGDGTIVVVNVEVLGDTLSEGDESVVLQLGNLTGPASSGTPAFHTVTIDDNEVAVVVTPTVGLVTTEAGGTAQFTVVLDTQPSDDVTVDLASSDPTEGDIAPAQATLTFTPANWDAAQIVTVTGVSDAVDDGDILYQIVIDNVQSTDLAYDGLDPVDVSLTNRDDDTAGISITPTVGLVTTESGGQATFDVVLDSEPTGTVEIDLTTSDAAEGLIFTVGAPTPAASKTLSFDAADWFTPQTVTLVGQPDGVSDGDAPYLIVTAPATISSGTDALYDGLNAADASAINIDEDTFGQFEFSAVAYAADEDQASVTVTVVRVGGATGATTVDYQTVDDEAAAPGDYTATGTQTLNFADGQTSATFDVFLQDDDEREVAETVSLELLGPGGGSTLGPRSRATLVIRDELTLEFLTTSPLADGQVGTYYAQQISLDDGGVNPSFSWSVLTGSLPPGLSLVGNSRDVYLQGTPTTAGVSNFELSVSDDDQPSATVVGSFQVTVGAAGGALTVNLLPAPPEGTVGVAYAHTFSALGGAPPYVWQLDGADTLPAGLSLNAFTGQLHGTPTVAGTTSNLTFEATDSVPTTASADFDVTIVPNQVRITTYVIPDGTEGAPYSVRVETRGGVGPTYSWSDTGLPAGLTLTGTGPTATLSGTPTLPGVYAFTLQVDDDGQAGILDTQEFIVVVNAAGAQPLTVTSTDLADGSVGVSYSEPLTASGGTGPYTWRVLSGTLPAGLSLDTSTGEISGVPSEAGSEGFIVEVTDATGARATAPLTLTVAARVQILTDSLPNAIESNGYFAQLETNFGVEPQQWTLLGGTLTGIEWSAGPLPAGVVFSATSGAFGGAPDPATAGTYPITVRVDDGNGSFDTQSLSLIVLAAPTGAGPTVLTDALSRATAGEAYSVALVAGGGVTPYQWTSVGSVLPAWATLETDGTLHGTPPASGTTPGLTFRATDAQPVPDDSVLLELVVTDPLSFVTTVLPQGTVRARYSTTLQASGGTQPYGWELLEGTLPAGIELVSATGELRGTPRVAGTFPLFLRVSDDDGEQVQRQLDLVIGSFAGLSPRGGGGCSLGAAREHPPVGLLVLVLACLGLAATRGAAPARSR